MKYLLVALMLALTSGAATLAQSTTMKPSVFTPADVKWTPGTGPLAGAQVAVVYGDPSKPGLYVIRLKMPDGTKFGPHFHGGVENVTVIEGTLLVGVGDVADPSKMTALPTGSFVSIPKGLHHFAMAKGDTIVEIATMGPRSMTAVKPK